MVSYSKTIIIGHLGAEPELRHTPSGSAVTNCRVAVNDGPRDKEDSTVWYRVTFWEKSAENVAKFFKKGDPILCEGKMRMRKYTNREDIEVEAWELHCYNFGFVSSKGDSDGSGGSSRRSRDTDDDDEPVRPSKRKVVARDEDEDDEPPARPAKRAVARRDEDDEDEDDEPAPPRRSSRHRA